MAPVVPSPAHVPPSPDLAHADSRPSSTAATDAAVASTSTSTSTPTPTPTPAPASTPSVQARSQSQDAIEQPMPLPPQPLSSNAHYVIPTDGRVRNPMPSKLKGMADSRNGNFGVMHMDVGKSEISARDAAAKRTSESTAAAARLANRNGYQSIKRSQFAFYPPDVTPQSLPPNLLNAASGSSTLRALAPFTGAAPAQVANDGSIPSIPIPHTTKTEQARLLTLLRSLHPVLVVDQLCKALAYFGGIPGAPPPADGKFPQSAATNGSGALLVNWLAEIFPPTTTVDPVNPAPAPASARPKSLRTAAAAAGGDGAGDGSGSSAPGPTGDSQTTFPMDNAMASPSNNEALSLSALTAVNATPQQPSQAASYALAGSQADISRGDTTMLSTPGSKKRGRPKGSRNKPKGPTDATPSDANAIGDLPASQQAPQADSSPLAQRSVPHHDSPGVNLESHPGTGVAEMQSTVQMRASLPHPAQAGPISSGSGNPSSSDPTAEDLRNAAVPRIDSVRKRKTGSGSFTNELNKNAPPSNPAPADTPLQAVSHAVQPSPTPNQPPKRRRVSKGSGQAIVGGSLQPQPPSVQPVSPPNPNASFGGSTQSTSSAGTVEPPAPADRLPAVRTAPRFNPNQRLQQQQQQQRQQQQRQQQQTHPNPRPAKSSSGSPLAQTQQSPNSSRSSLPTQPSPKGGRDNLGNPQPRQQAPNFYATSPGNRPPQAFYPPQQRQQQSTSYEQIANAGNNFNLNLTHGPPTSQYSQMLSKRVSGEGGLPHGIRQGRMTASQEEQAQDAMRRPGFASGQPNSSSSGPTPGTNQFQSYADGNYMNMDLHTANAAAAAFGGNATLEENTTDSSMRGRIY
jgi:hypothetical protein